MFSSWPFTFSLLARGTQHALLARGCRPAGSLFFTPPSPTPSRGYRGTDHCPPGGSGTSSPDERSAPLERGCRIPSRTGFLSSARLKTPPAPLESSSSRVACFPTPLRTLASPQRRQQGAHAERAADTALQGPSPLRRGSRDRPGLCEGVEWRGAGQRPWGKLKGRRPWEGRAQGAQRELE